MRNKIRAGLWVCRSGYFTRLGAVKRGAVIPRDLPYEVMDGHEQWFAEVECAEEPAGPFKVRPGREEPAQEVVEEIFEQATAAPGEKRTTRRRSSPKA